MSNRGNPGGLFLASVCRTGIAGSVSSSSLIATCSILYNFLYFLLQANSGSGSTPTLKRVIFTLNQLPKIFTDGTYFLSLLLLQLLLSSL